MSKKREKGGSQNWKFYLIVLVAVLVRLCVGLGSFSGAGDKPKYGDFEAQRHWMEITTNLPIRDWYRQTEDNDLKHWGLDYPPLSAYQSWLYGKIIEVFDPMTVTLHESRGYEGSKTLMRWSVLLSDIGLIFAALAWAHQLGRTSSIEAQVTTLACVLLQPALILIDHGHFQYNTISLGLSMGGAIAIIQGWHVVGSVLYCCAINHKHIALYYAPGFFGYLLGCCLKSRSSLKQVTVLGITVIATFSIIWLPFIWQPVDKDYIEVLHRLVPLGRGVFEDYVANFWCSTKPLFRWKGVFAQNTMAVICLIATMGSVLPSMIHQILNPSHKGFLYSLANSALGFFLFSYQTHEKSILYALLPITMLAASEPFLAKWIVVVASFSMYPLLERDHLVLQYGASIIMYLAIPLDPSVPTSARASQQKSMVSKSRGFSSWKHIWVALSGLAMIVLHLLRVTITSSQYPYIHDYAFVSFSFGHIFLAYLYLNYKQVIGISRKKID